MNKEQLEELSSRVRNKRLSFESSVPVSLEDMEFLINAALERYRLRCVIKILEADYTEARAVAATLGHAYETDNRPPDEALDAARSWRS